MMEVVGDLWLIPATWRGITTNGVTNMFGKAVMGAGCALEAKQRYPELPGQLGRLLLTHKLNVPYLFRHFQLLTFPTKNHWREDSRLEIIERSAAWIRNWMADGTIEGTFIMPRPGCGHGNLQWRNVAPILEQYFTDDRYIIVAQNAEQFRR